MIPPIYSLNKGLLSPFCRCRRWGPDLAAAPMCLWFSPCSEPKGTTKTGDHSNKSWLGHYPFNLWSAQLGKKPQHCLCEHRVTVRVEYFQLVSHFLHAHLVQAKPFPSHRCWIFNLCPHLLQVCFVKWVGTALGGWPGVRFFTEGEDRIQKTKIQKSGNSYSRPVWSDAVATSYMWLLRTWDLLSATEGLNLVFQLILININLNLKNDHLIWLLESINMYAGT